MTFLKYLGVYYFHIPNIERGIIRDTGLLSINHRVMAIFGILISTETTQISLISTHISSVISIALNVVRTVSPAARLCRVRFLSG